MQRAGFKAPLSNGGDKMDICGDGGLLKTLLKEGVGEVIPDKSVAKVHYVGTLNDGTVFDSSRSRGKPFKFTLGKRNVILGWDKGVATMKKGEVCLLQCSPEYGYGGQHVGPIPPNSTLTFEVELLDFATDGIDSPIPEKWREYLGYIVLLIVFGSIYAYMVHGNVKVPKIMK